MDTLSPASPEDIASALMHALRFSARRRVHDADELMARIVADRLAEHLQRCGFVIFTQAPAAPPQDCRTQPKARQTCPDDTTDTHP